MHSANILLPANLPVVTDPAIVKRAARAIVYCYVEWSVPERVGRETVREAVTKLRYSQAPIAFEFFALDEDSPAALAWLGQSFAAGSGLVLWTELETVVAREQCAANAGATA